ncbi:hypothetical protein JTE90_015015 [Oedothorax gibbosus]|uniref:C2H2-type domain-containing protein n=1 Tax=Oedothorax gibbosus TaxID=931172 RepID=A0AAV6TW64_9ARAC|nr:hypothetical protein JTE90_015015 [Oedothorax gibbosus]
MSYRETNPQQEEKHGRAFLRAVRNGTLRLYAPKKRWTDMLKACRLCGHAFETVGHVLNHCRSHARLWHDDIQNRLTHAIAGNTPGARVVSVNQRVKDVGGSPLRPDIVIDQSDGSRLLVDVTVPVEHVNDAFRTRASFDKARRTKIDKYRCVADALSARGVRTRVEALIVGALGTWDSKNAPVLRQLGLVSDDLRDVLCRRTVTWARRIYDRHLKMGATCN